jgi:hypothetical protein
LSVKSAMDSRPFATDVEFPEWDFYRYARCGMTLGTTQQTGSLDTPPDTIVMVASTVDPRGLLTGQHGFDKCLADRQKRWRRWYIGDARINGLSN